MFQDLLHLGHHSPEQSVPDWMIGCFRRRCISFANGTSDNQTVVYWLQSRNFSIDLRLPSRPDQVPARKLSEYSAAELAVLANYEGWEAPSQWDGTRLRWSGGTALQMSSRWPEDAQLSRIGNCMIEFAPSGAYVEDWRLQPSMPGPLIGLRLIEEHYPESDLRHPRGGGLIVCGDHAALVLGRSRPLATAAAELPVQVANAHNDPALLQQLFDFETSVATADPARVYTVQDSTVASRVGQPLLPDGTFEPVADSNRVQYRFTRSGQTCTWLFEIDVIEKQHAFSLSTPSPEASQTWFDQEAATLTRYTGMLS